MNSTPASPVPAIRAPRRPLSRGLLQLALMGALSASLLAQPPADPAAPGGGRTRRGQNADGTENPNGGRGGRGNFDPAQMQEMMMARVREQFGVTDDAEWKLISERIAAVTALRTAGGPAAGLAGLFGGRGGGGGFGGGQGGGGRAGRGGAASPEVAALSQAITDKLPDAEIKARLTTLREARKANEEKLAKAQEDLRAVLDVRQEAIAVMAGYLP